jgi:hypothetical protein
MTFGKPKPRPCDVRCIDCGEQYPDGHTILKHAGRTVDGDFWNSKCPECGSYNGMLPEYARMTDEEFLEEQHEMARIRLEAYREQTGRDDYPNSL